MPAYKTQHFVPRCLLKPFSQHRAGKAINLYAVGNRRLVTNAPVKGQCARDYLYGADGAIERGLSTIEGGYADALSRVERRAETASDLADLRFFAFLQLRRTEIAIQRMKMAQDAFMRQTFEDAAPAELPLEYFMVQSLQSCFETEFMIRDLKVRVVENRTSDHFVTSDDPAVMTNRYHARNADISGMGVCSSGVILFMPLTPQLGVLCYDGLVYTIPNLTNGRVVVDNVADAHALNELQYLKAAKAIYFSSWDSREAVREQFEAHRSRRIEDWFVIRHAAFSHSDGSGSIFKEVSLETARNTKETVVHTYFRYPVPSRWISHLRYRSPVRTFSSNHGMAEVRKREWLDLRPT